MARPSTRAFREFGIIEQLQQAGVTAVMNLTEPGEHPFCGDGLEPRQAHQGGVAADCAVLGAVGWLSLGASIHYM